MVSDASPTEKLSENDKGDDTLRRFRYQCTYAAIISLNMFSENSTIEEIFCELHEDILVKLKTGRFIGIQVKTRENHLGPFAIDDIEIKKSIVRFIQHESRFQNYFDHYTISTNAGFSKAKNKCLQTLINFALDNRPDELLKPRTKSKTWIKEIAQIANCKDKEVIHVLSKLKLYDKISSLQDIEYNFINKLAEILHLKNETLGLLHLIANNIIIHHVNASSLSNHEALSEFYILCKEHEKTEIREIINSKRVTKENLTNIIERLRTEPISLFLKDNNSIPKNFDNKIMEIKMDAGGISYDNIKLAKDQKFSIEALTTSWLYKYDQIEAVKRYNQVKLIINTECQEAYDEEEQKDKSFGSNMLKKVRLKLRERYKTDAVSFFDCKYEHLLGMVGVLTEECLVWWSEKFKI